MCSVLLTHPVSHRCKGCSKLSDGQFKNTWLSENTVHSKYGFTNNMEKESALHEGSKRCCCQCVIRILLLPRHRYASGLPTMKVVEAELCR